MGRLGIDRPVCSYTGGVFTWPDQGVIDVATEPTKVNITGSDTAVDPKRDPGTPTGYNGLPSFGGEKIQVKGTAGDDRASLETLLHDKDQVIHLGAGDDIFVFSNATGGNTSINGIVDGGTNDPLSGSNLGDQVFFAGELSDYLFTIRSDGGIKAQYFGGGVEGAAVTFRNFETFTFRGIDSTTTPNPTNHVDQTLSYAELIAKIEAASGIQSTINHDSLNF